MFVRPIRGHTACRHCTKIVFRYKLTRVYLSLIKDSLFCNNFCTLRYRGDCAMNVVVSQRCTRCGGRITHQHRIDGRDHPHCDALFCCMDCVELYVLYHFSDLRIVAQYMVSEGILGGFHLTTVMLGSLREYTDIKDSRNGCAAIWRRYEQLPLPIN
jgi:hypothetical protein